MLFRSERGVHAASTNELKDALESDAASALHATLKRAEARASADADEWRIHFHIPLHSPATALFDNTTDHLTELLDVLGENPKLCPHLEFETYTWEVLPPELKNESVVTQLVREYEWCLKELASREILNKQSSAEHFD